MFKRFRTRKASARRAVRGDWSASLPQEKLELFKHIEKYWEICNVMLSISLDEGLRLVSSGAPLDARQCAANSVEFLNCLAMQLLAVLDTMEKHGRHFGTLPLVKPLETSCFRGQAAQAAASWNYLFHKVLMSSRSRFFHKMQILHGLVEDIADQFVASAEDLAEDSAKHSAAGWEELESLQYDLNTCLCETTVVLKSFLRALPEEELKPFRNRLDDARETVRLHTRSFIRIPT